MGSIISKKDSVTVPIPKAVDASSSLSQGKKSWFSNPLGKKVGPNAGDSGQDQLTSFLDNNGSILTKSNKTDFGQSFFQYSDSISAPDNNDKRQTNFIRKMSLGELKIQKPAPRFSGTAVVDGQFKDISLDDYKGKYLVFFFYPLDFTFVCPTEIIAFSDRVDEFRKIDCEIIAASTDSHFSHLAWVNTPRKQGGLGKMDIPLLADKTGDIAKAYGVYKDDAGIAFRGLFIIDNKQNLRQITINDLPVGRSVDETLRLVQAFQFTDKFGEVCPAGWKPGQKTIKPSVDQSKEFFQEQ